MNSNDQPENFGIPFAQNGKKNAIPKEKNTSQKPNEASYDTGFPDITMELISAGGLPPFGQDMNGALNEMSNEIRWTHAGGFTNFDATFATQIGGYPKGALLWNAKQTAFYLSLVNNNTQNPDTTNPPTQWRVFKPVDVVQTTGSSTENVMSQKASTDIFAKKNSSEVFQAGKIIARGVYATVELVRTSDSSYIDIEYAIVEATLNLIFRTANGTNTGVVQITPDGNIIGDAWQI